MMVRSGAVARSAMTAPGAANLGMVAARRTGWRAFLRGAHHLRAALFFVASASGFLLFSPTLRAEVTGGYALSLERMHFFLGLAFTLLCVLPLRISIPRPRGELGDCAVPSSRRRLTRRLASGGVAALLMISGLAIWFNLALPVAIVDAADDLHVWLTYAACLVVAVHIWEALRSAAHRRRAGLGGSGSVDNEVVDLAKAAFGS